MSSLDSIIGNLDPAGVSTSKRKEKERERVQAAASLRAEMEELRARELPP